MDQDNHIRLNQEWDGTQVCGTETLMLQLLHGAFGLLIHLLQYLDSGKGCPGWQVGYFGHWKVISSHCKLMNSVSKSLVFFFLLSRAAFEAYGGSQARGQIGATGAGP